MSEPVRLHDLALDVAGFSEQGPRPENQDAFVADALGRAGIVAVADGMGGERGGRLAADIALRTVVGAAPIRNLDDARRAARAADQAVAAAAAENPAERAGMGCALGLLALVRTRGNGAGWVGAHVGDVRIVSRSPDGTVRLETRDHTPAFARWEAGEIELDEIPDTPGANRLQRAVGRNGEADVTWLPARPGWSYVIVSDGIYKEMRLDELGDAIGGPSAAAACETIRQKVAERGPDDNFTAVVVRVLGEPGTPPMPAAAPVARPEPTRDMPDPVPPARTDRSSWLVAIGLLSLLALLAAGAALWMARQAGTAAADRAELQRVQLQVDSLRARVGQIAEPFGPSASTPDTVAAMPATTTTQGIAPAGRTAPPTAPRTATQP